MENAFSRLKGKFNSLGKRLDVNAYSSVPQLKYPAVYSTVFVKSCTRNFNNEEWLLTIEINNEICLRGVVNQIQDRNAAKIREATKSYLFSVPVLPSAVSKKKSWCPTFGYNHHLL